MVQEKGGRNVVQTTIIELLQELIDLKEAYAKDAKLLKTHANKLDELMLAIRKTLPERVWVRRKEQADNRQNSSLTRTDVEYILSHPEIHYTELMDRFGISRATILNIRAGRVWVDVSRNYDLDEINRQARHTNKQFREALTNK